MPAEVAGNYQTVIAGRWNRHSSDYPQTKQLLKTGSQVAQDEVTQLLLSSLTKLNVDVVGDGGFRWDSVYDVTRGIKGCSGFDQLTRIPGTNQFHRQPIAELPLFREDPLLVKDLKFAQEHTSKPLVVSLPGPYSTARQTQNVAELGMGVLSNAYADVFNREIDELIRQGALVRIEEPQILDHPEDTKIFQDAMGHLTKGIDLSRLALATWFGGIKDPNFYQLPFGIFVMDFVGGRESLSTLDKFPADKKLIAGVIDAQHPYQESDQELQSLVGAIARHLSPDQILLSTNTDLHFLPWNEAVGKVDRLVEFATAYRLGTVSKVAESTPTRVISGIKKLEDLAIPNNSHAPIPRIAFPTSTVGSFPQPQELRTARLQLKRDKIDEAEYLQLAQHFTKYWMDEQNRFGITVPVSGEFLRDDMAAYFGRQWGGIEGDFVPSYENRRYHPIIYADRLRFGSPLTIEDFRFLQLLSNRPVKHTLTGPATMTDWALIKNGKYYADQHGFKKEFAQAIRSEVEALIAAGAKVIQIDEPALTAKIKQLPTDLEAIYDTVQGFRDLSYLILHMCYSDMRALDEALPDILQLPVHQIHMEIANRGYGMLRLIEKHGFGNKDVGLGVLDVHKDRVETVDEILKGVRMARELFTPEQIWLTPDCGLKERSREVTLAKLAAMSEAAKIARVLLV